MKRQKGITLIALVITIIVLLILAGVSISLVVGQNGVLSNAQNSVIADAKAKEEEGITTSALAAMSISSSKGNIALENGYFNQELKNEFGEGNYILEEQTDKFIVTIVETGNSYEVDKFGNVSVQVPPEDGAGGIGGGDEMFPYDETVTDSNGFLTSNATYESGDYTAVIPKGFKVSEVPGETEIETGLVVIDQNGNEFVWVPVMDDLQNSYSSGAGYIEPCNITAIHSESGYAYDSQEILDYYHPGKGYIWTEGMYETEYISMVESVNENNGFYIARYETTIDSNEKIGSVYNTEILSDTHISLSWYDFYNMQKTANVIGNGSNVQTAMIYGVLWDETMQFIRDQYAAGNTSFTVDSEPQFWGYVNNGINQTVNAGQEYQFQSGYTDKDVEEFALNIWGLVGNAVEWTQECCSSCYRMERRNGCIQDFCIC